MFIYLRRAAEGLREQAWLFLALACTGFITGNGFCFSDMLKMTNR